MAKAWYFPRWRHLLMQILMWVILGASVALAAMLNYHLRTAQMVQLTDPIVDDTLTFRLPAGWKTVTRTGEGDATDHIAVDSSGQVQRTLLIRRQRVPRLIPPAEYILRTLSVPLNGHLQPQEFKGVMIAGWPGQSITWEARRTSMSDEADYDFASCSAIVLPDDEAITVRYDKNAPFDATDRHLYQQILDQLQLSIAPPLSGGHIDLPHDISVNVPQDLYLYPSLDPLRGERTVAVIADDGWTSAEFIPVAVPNAVPGSELPASLLAGLSAREQFDPRATGLSDRWLSAEINIEAPNHWTISPPDAPTEAIAPRRIAHLLTGPGGWGLLVLLSAEPPASRADLDHLWDEISANLRVPKSEPLNNDLQKGAELSSAAPQMRPPATWLMWSRGSIPIGYTHQEAKYPFRYTARRNWNGTATGVVQQWGVGPDTAPLTEMKRFDGEASLADSLVFVFEEVTTVGDTIVTIIHEYTGREPVSSVPASPSFVFSRYFPSLLSRVTAPTAFWTDRFPGIEGEKLSSPLLLLARPVGGGNGLTAIEAGVNATGSVSRWYFHPDGSLDHADFAGDLHLRPTTADEVQSAFAGDRRLTTQPH
jgi:hypothetical protein